MKQQLAYMMYEDIMSDKNRDDWDSYRMYVTEKLSTMEGKVNELDRSITNVDKKVDQISWKVSVIVAIFIFVVTEGPKLYKLIME